MRQKPPALLADKRPSRTGRRVVAVVGAPRPTPAPPPNIGPLAIERWHAFWRSPISGAVDLDADLSALERWVTAIDERERLLQRAQRRPLVRGSQGQMVLNPLFRRIDVLTREIERAEDRFGMSPQSRFRLQLTFTEAQRADHDLRRQLLRDRQAMATAPSAAARPEAAAAEIIDLDTLG